MATKIYNVADLQSISSNLVGSYELANDIDASGYDFQPMGAFTGSLDGCGYTIYNLTISRGNYDTTQDILPASDTASFGTWTVYPASPTTLYDKVQVSDVDGTYIESSTANARALFGFSVNVPDTAAGISVRVYNRRKRIGDGTAAQCIRVGGVDYDSSTSTPITSYGTTSTLWSTNPATGKAWTSYEVNNLQGFGVKVVSGTVRSTWVYIRITFNLDYLGLFSNTNGATLKNIGFDNVSITGNIPTTGTNSQYIGSLVGYSYESTIENIDVNNVVVRGFYRYVGGIVGYSDTTLLSECSASGVDVYSATSGRMIGGIVGYSSYDTIEDCNSVVSINVIDYGCGGVAGYLYGVVCSRCNSVGELYAKDDSGGCFGIIDGGSEVSQCASSVDVVCFNDRYCSGGFVGYNYGNSTISNCYSIGSVAQDSSYSSWSGVGGFCGANYGIIDRCYSIGLVSGEGDNIGGFCGENYSVISHSFWDIDTSGRLVGIGLGGDPIEWWVTDNRSYVGDHSAYCGRDVTFLYQNNQLSILEIKDPVDLSATTSPSLDFYLWPDIENNYDFLYVDVSIDGGVNWDYGIWNYTGRTQDWISQSVDLSFYKSKQVKIRFRFTSDSSVIYEGPYIDDVIIKDGVNLFFYDDFESGTYQWLFEEAELGVGGKTTSEMQELATFLEWDTSGTFQRGYPRLGWEVGAKTDWVIYPLRFNLNRKTAAPRDAGSFSTLRRFTIGGGKVVRQLKNIINFSSVVRRLSSIITESKLTVRRPSEPFLKIFSSLRDFGAGYSASTIRYVDSIVYHGFNAIRRRTNVVIEYKSTVRKPSIPFYRLFNTFRDFAIGYIGGVVRRIGHVLGADHRINVQHGILALTSGLLTNEVILDNPVPIGKSFVISSCRGNGTNPDALTARVELTEIVNGSYTKIRATRRSSSYNSFVEWQVISGGSIKVQSGVLDFGGGGTTRTLNISEVDLSKAFIVLSATGATTWIRRSAVRARFLSSTQVEFYAECSTTLYPIICWYLVEWDGADVQSGAVSVTGTSSTDSIVDINQGNTLLLFNYATTASTNASEALVRGRFSSNNQVEFMRGSSGNECYISYFCISHPKISVKNELITVTDLVGSFKFDKEVGDRFLSTHQFGNAYSTSNIFYCSFNTHSIYFGDGEDEAVVQRAGSSGELYASVQVISPTYIYVPLPKFSSARRLVSAVSENKSSLRRISIEFPVKVFKTFRGFAAECFGSTARITSTLLFQHSDLNRQYRRKIIITETGGGDYNTYPTLIDVPFCTGMNNNFSDVLFTEVNGKTLIPFGLRSKTDGVTAKFVLVRNYKALESQSIYLYYGNSSASSSSVAFTSWVDTWYSNNSWGGGIAAYTNQTCSQYPHSRSGNVPSWAGDVFYINHVPDSYARFNVWYGRSYINSLGNTVAWSQTSVCDGLATSISDPWGRRDWNQQSLNNAGWSRGEVNTVYFGHFQSGDPSVGVSWLPQDPAIQLLQEENYVSFTTARRLALSITNLNQTVRRLSSSISFVGKTVRAVYVELANVLTLRRVDKIIAGEFGTNRKIANVVTEYFKSLRRLAFSHIKSFTTKRLFSFFYSGKTVISNVLPLEPINYTNTYKGEWDSITSYTKDDIVYDNNKTYKAKVSNSSTSPTDSSYWECLYDGQHKFIIPESVNSVDVLVVAAGGGGGCMGGQHQYGYNNSGGGGAGGLVFVEGYNISKYKTVNEVSVVVGKGGAGGVVLETYCGDNGENSSFGDLISIGGGGGGLGVSYCNNYQAKQGGSGGGGGYWRNNAGPPYTSCCSGAFSNQPTTNDSYIGTGFGNSGVGCPGGGGGAGGQGSGSSPYAGGIGKQIFGVTYSVGGSGSRSTILSGDPNTGNGGDGGSSTTGTRLPGGDGGSGIVIVKYSIIHKFNSLRRLSEYVSYLGSSIRKPSIFISYIAKALRLFGAEFIGSTYRFGINVVTIPMKTVRRLSSDITDKFSTVRKPSIFTEYISKTLRLFSFVGGFIGTRLITIFTEYSASANRRLSSVFIDKFKALRFPSIFYEWVGATFRRVGELCIDLINRVTFPPKE